MARAKKKGTSNTVGKSMTEAKKTAPVETLSVASKHREKEGTMTLNPHYVLFFLMIAVFLGCFALLRPYIHTILLALILTFVASPVHERIERKLGGRKNLAAAVSSLLLTLVVVLPLFFIVFSLIRHAVLTFTAIGEFVASGKAEALLRHPMAVKLGDLIRHVLPDVQKFIPDLASVKPDKLVMETSATLGKAFLNQSGRIAGNVGALITNFFLMLFTFFFMIRDEARLLDQLLHLVPLTDSQERQIIGKVKDVARSALLGTFVTALAQGAAGGLAFFVCGLPGLFWGMVMAFASLIPMVGTALIWIPACLYLVFSGQGWYAAGLAIWCVVVVGGIDNFVRPLFMQGGSDMHTLVIFFSIIGGINTFGLLGLLYGPLLFGLALVLLYIYGMEFRTFLEDQDKR